MERETHTINAKLNIVPGKLESFDQEIQAIDKRLTDESTRLDELRKAYRKYESNIDENLSKMKKSEEKLRAVKTNKEYQSTLKEIEDIKAINSKIEDEMIDCLDQMDEAEKYLATKADEFRILKDQIETEKEAIYQESEADRIRIKELEREWDSVSKQIDPELMKTYHQVQDQRGVAIVAVNNAVCQGCNMNIPPQMYNELQKGGSLRFCPHCQRIIYWKET
jgi:predicted  nucleic acid-binding Zn-ribbon protein